MISGETTSMRVFTLKLDGNKIAPIFIFFHLRLFPACQRDWRRYLVARVFQPVPNVEEGFAKQGRKFLFPLTSILSRQGRGGLIFSYPGSIHRVPNEGGGGFPLLPLREHPQGDRLG